MSQESTQGAPEEGRPNASADDTAHAEGLGHAAESIDMAEAEAVLGTTSAVDELIAVRQELDETRANMLRALAEAENVRRRAQRDASDARQYAVSGFARDLLNVADNFQRALAAIDADAALPDDLKAMVDGIRMTERELQTIFERHGVTVIEPVGERFDPNRHQAIFEIEDKDVASGTVLQVMQSGAVIGERTLRPAMVGVSKGGPKPGSVTPPAEDDASDAATPPEDGDAG